MLLLLLLPIFWLLLGFSPLLVMLPQPLLLLPLPLPLNGGCMAEGS
jgi:hypothetical protein